MRLLITDVTEMSPGNFCVAGWDNQNGRMIRPLPNGRNWTVALLAQFGVMPGATIDFHPTGIQHPSAYPHQNEDTSIAAIATVNINGGPVNWFAAGVPPTSVSIDAAFGGHATWNSVWHGVHQGVYVPIGTNIGSLAAIELLPNRIVFVEEFGKLRATVHDGQADYKLAVSSAVLKDAWRRGGLLGVNQALPQATRFHVRLGLARAFDQPAHKCYMMINGVHG